MSPITVAIENPTSQPTPGAVINSGTYGWWAPRRLSSRAICRSSWSTRIRRWQARRVRRARRRDGARPGVRQGSQHRGGRPPARLTPPSARDRIQADVIGAIAVLGCQRRRRICCGATPSVVRVCRRRPGERPRNRTAALGPPREPPLRGPQDARERLRRLGAVSAAWATSKALRSRSRELITDGAPRRPHLRDPRLRDPR